MSTVKTNNLQLGQSLTATNNFSWYQPSSPDGTVRLGVGNAGATSSDVLVANSSGNVGIGTSSPSTKLNIVGDNNNAYFQSSTGTAATYSRWSNSGGSAYIGLDNSAGSALGLAYALHIQSPTSVALHVNGSGSVAALLDSSGNLGLGVTPSAWDTSIFKAFQIGQAGSVAGRANDTSENYYTANAYYNGSWKYINTNYASQYVQSAGTHYWRIAASGSAGGTISFTQAMTLDASGNLLVGTTSQGTTEKFSAYQSSSNSAAGRFYASSTSYTNDIVQISCARSGASTEYNALTVFDNTSTLKMLIRANGNILNANNSYGSLSDKNIKENIVDATPKLQDLLAVRIRNFNLVGETTKQIGVVAQELEKVFPNMVEENADGLKSVKYSVFVPMLVKAIQELSAQVTTLQAEINELKA